MKNNQGNNKNYSETYQKFVEKITKITKNDNPNINNQNRDTFSNKTFSNNKSEININQNNFGNEQANNYKEQQRLMYEKMNQKIINRRRNIDWNQKQDYTNDVNNNGQKNMNRNEIDSYKVFYDKSGGYPLGGGKNAPIVQLLNQKNNEYAHKYQNGYQDQNLINQNQNQNNIHIHQSSSFDNINFPQNNNQNINYNNKYPFKTNPQNNDDFTKNNNLQNSSQSNNSITVINVNNKYKNNIPEISKNNINSNNYKINLNQNQINNSINYNNPNDGNINNENNDPNNSDKSSGSGIASSLFYGLIFGSFGTLLLWCKNPKVREYLKSCYQNINTESIFNFFKSFLHPIDLIKSINIGALQKILQESLNYLYQFIDDYSDLWRLLGVIVMVYAFWLIIKIIYRKLKKSENKKKKKKIKPSDNMV